MVLSNIVFDLLALVVFIVSFLVVLQGSRCIRRKLNPYLAGKKIDNSSGLQIVILIIIIPLVLLWFFLIPILVRIFSSENIDSVDFLLGLIGLLVVCFLGLYWGWGDIEPPDESISKRYYLE